MNSTNSSGNSFTTPQSSPETSEADLRSLEYALDNFRHHLQDTVHSYDTFNEHFQFFSSQDDNVLQRLNQTIDAPNEQVSDHLTHTHQAQSIPQQPSSQLDDLQEVRIYFPERLPTYPKRRVTSTSFTSSDQHLNSSLGSDSLFGSPDTSFLGFESTAGISGLPFYNQVTTMTGNDDTVPTHPIIEDEEPSEGWKKFYKYAIQMLKSVSTEVKLLEKHLQSTAVTQSVAQINTHVFKTNRFRTKLATLEDDLKEAIYSEAYPQSQLELIQNDIASLYFDVDTQHALIEESLENARDKLKEKDAMAAALRQVANTPTVDLPKFDGKTIDYKAFKEHFNFVIQKVNGPKELWATHLVNSLQGPAKQYIGSENKWFNKYEDLWDMLDSKYNNEWTLYYETLAAFFYNILQSEEPEPLKNFFYTQLDNISSIEALGLTVGELLTTYLIESLPQSYKSKLKEAIKSQQPNKQKATVTPQEARKVFNNTISATLDETSKHVQKPPAFLANYGQSQRRHRRGRGSGHWSNRSPPQPAAPAATPPPAPAAPAVQPAPQTGTPAQPQGTWPQPQSPQHYYQNGYPGNNDPAFQNLNYRGGYQGYRGGRGYRGYRGGYGGSSRRRLCFICQDDSKYDHLSKECPTYTTAAARRDRLVAIGRCNCCTRLVHQGPCNLTDCTVHPGERHWRYLCGDQPHPGRNA